jgi:hypothetical protein
MHVVRKCDARRRKVGLGWNTHMEWFSALDIAKKQNHPKNKCKCLPISKVKTTANKAQ